MSIYERVLGLAREQSAALARGDLDSAVARLDARAALLDGAPAADGAEVAMVHEIMRLDRDLSSAIRQRMLAIRDEALHGQQAQRALSSYGRRLRPRPLAVDRVS